MKRTIILATLLLLQAACSKPPLGFYQSVAKNRFYVDIRSDGTGVLATRHDVELINRVRTIMLQDESTWPINEERIIWAHKDKWLVFAADRETLDQRVAAAHLVLNSNANFDMALVENQDLIFRGERFRLRK